MMLAMRLLSAARGGSDEQDVRTVDSVLAAAAKRLGEPSTPAASRQLEANGVKWAWQMAHFSEADWDQLGVSLGMKTAAKKELEEPSVSTSDSKAQKYKTQDELTDRMRRFLLLPDADGKEAKPLGEMSALFLGLMATPVENRQSLLLALCELVALVGGLMLSVPFEFRTRIAGVPLDAAPPENIWLAPPTLTDGRDALIAFVFLLNIHVTCFAVALALYVAASGVNADDAFCEGVMNVLGVFFVIIFMMARAPPHRTDDHMLSTNHALCWWSDGLLVRRASNPDLLPRRRALLLAVLHRRHQPVPDAHQPARRQPIPQLHWRPDPKVLRRGDLARVLPLPQVVPAADPRHLAGHGHLSVRGGGAAQGRRRAARRPPA